MQLLVVLAVLWGAVLIPPWIADRRRDRPVQTMASFHRRLWQLEQLEHSPHSVVHALDGRGTAAAAAAVAWHGDGYEDVDHDLHDDGHLHEERSGPVIVTGLSRAALRRRRQVFFALLAGVIVSLAVLVLLRTATAVAVHVGALVLFTGYVTLLVRHHQRATEQVSKVRYLSPIRAPRPAVVVLRSGTAR